MLGKHTFLLLDFKMCMSLNQMEDNIYINAEKKYCKSLRRLMLAEIKVLFLLNWVCCSGMFVELLKMSSGYSDTKPR